MAKTTEKTLVIVESPAKSKTIKKILGDNYIIEASFGHIRDLPPKGLGFDIENDFKPTFAIIPEKKKQHSLDVFFPHPHQQQKHPYIILLHRKENHHDHPEDCSPRTDRADRYTNRIRLSASAARQHTRCHMPFADSL